VGSLVGLGVGDNVGTLWDKTTLLFNTQTKMKKRKNLRGTLFALPLLRFQKPAIEVMTKTDILKE